jgi:PHD/YefM family antitoxin component YafN of YafNO toxin-antitoxin module
VRVKVSALREAIAHLLQDLREPITVMRYGDPIAVIVTPADFAELKRLRGLYKTRAKEHGNRLASV